MRLLVIGAQAAERLLVRKHVEIDWPDAVLVEHQLGKDPPFEQQFAAAGFDAVIAVAASPDAEAFALAHALAARPEFAPTVLIVLEDAKTEAPLSAPPRLHLLQARKVNRDKLMSAIHVAAAEHRRALAALRANLDFEQRYRFGDVMIRGHRCLREVGRGGMCRIYLAESERAGGLVVLKVFNQVPDVSERSVSFDRFLQEYEIVAGLNHQNIVRIHDLGVADDHAYIAMEHFPAGDLRARMKTPITPALALLFLKQLAAALEAIHSVGVLHRDLKPANIMLRSDNSLCLIDFGLAKTNEADTSLTGAREIFGTPYYMSPEQGHAELIDARSDLYSLGVVFYEMLTGQKPFTGTSAMEVIYKHKRAPVPPIAATLAPYQDIVLRLLAKSPAERFQSAADVLSAVAALEAVA